RTVGSLPAFSAPSSSISLDCWRMAILVPSGMPGMSFSWMALSSAEQQVSLGRASSKGVSGANGEQRTRLAGAVAADKGISLALLQAKFGTAENLNALGAGF